MDKQEMNQSKADSASIRRLDKYRSALAVSQRRLTVAERDLAESRSSLAAAQVARLTKEVEEYRAMVAQLSGATQ